MSDKIKILLVEDDIDFMYLIRKMISQDKTLDFAGYAESKFAGIELAKKIEPDIVLMDLNLSNNEFEGIEAAREIKLATNAKILLLTSNEESKAVITASKKSFASGYIFKSQCQTLNDVIQKTAHSHTPQAQIIKELILQDLSEAERGVFDTMLGTEPIFYSADKTIANQKTNIFKKLGIKNTRELIHIFKNW